MYSYAVSSPYQKDYLGGIPEMPYLLATNFGTTNSTFPIRPILVGERDGAISNYEAWMKADYKDFPSFQALDSNLEIWPELINIYQQPIDYSITLAQEKKIYAVPGTDEYVREMIGANLYQKIFQEDREFLKLASNMFNLGEKVNIKRILSSLEEKIR